MGLYKQILMILLCKKFNGVRLVLEAQSHPKIPYCRPITDWHKSIFIVRGLGKYNNACLLTDLENGPKNGTVVYRRAVPPPVPELPLALRDARTGTLAHAAHVVLVKLTELGLSRGETADVGAQW